MTAAAITEPSGHASESGVGSTSALGKASFGVAGPTSGLSGSGSLAFAEVFAGQRDLHNWADGKQIETSGSNGSSGNRISDANPKADPVFNPDLRSDPSSGLLKDSQVNLESSLVSHADSNLDPGSASEVALDAAKVSAHQANSDQAVSAQSIRPWLEISGRSPGSSSPASLPGNETAPLSAQVACSSATKAARAGNASSATAASQSSLRAGSGDQPQERDKLRSTGTHSTIESGPNIAPTTASASIAIAAGTHSPSLLSVQIGTPGIPYDPATASPTSRLGIEPSRLAFAPIAQIATAKLPSLAAGISGAQEKSRYVGQVGGQLSGQDSAPASKLNSSLNADFTSNSAESKSREVLGSHTSAGEKQFGDMVSGSLSSVSGSGAAGKAVSGSESTPSGPLSGLATATSKLAPQGLQSSRADGLDRPTTTLQGVLDLPGVLWANSTGGDAEAGGESKLATGQRSTSSGIGALSYATSATSAAQARSNATPAAYVPLSSIESDPAAGMGYGATSSVSSLAPSLTAVTTATRTNASTGAVTPDGVVSPQAIAGLSHDKTALSGADLAVSSADISTATIQNSQGISSQGIDRVAIQLPDKDSGSSFAAKLSHSGKSASRLHTPVLAEPANAAGAGVEGAAQTAQSGLLGQFNPSGQTNLSGQTGSAEQRAVSEFGDLSHNPFPLMDSVSGSHGIGSSAVSGSSSGSAPQLQVGYQDPVLGYVELRAHSTGGAVHAEFGVQSEVSGETLQSHLGSLAGWMDDRNTPAESLTVANLNSSSASAHSFPGNGHTGGNLGSDRSDGGTGKQASSTNDTISIANGNAVGLGSGRDSDFDSGTSPDFGTAQGMTRWRFEPKPSHAGGISVVA